MGDMLHLKLPTQDVLSETGFLVNAIQQCTANVPLHKATKGTRPRLTVFLVLLFEALANSRLYS